MHFDVFNGDADGIIALLQLRLAKPKRSTLITGVKRDIQLLDKLDVRTGDSVTVLDISMKTNQVGLKRALSNGAHIFYADHHQSGQIPLDPNLEADIDLNANTCTALIIDKRLNGRFHTWAITAAYGDNLIAKADELAEQAGLSFDQRAQLKELGTLINYNSYGANLADLHIEPARLFQQLLAYDDPFAVIADPSSPFHTLRQAYQQDINAVLALKPIYQSSVLRVFELPNQAQSRRVSGAYSNLLTHQAAECAHVVLTQNSHGSYTVSLRAPLNNKQGAGDICSQFATGGGREAAGGINALDKQLLKSLIEAVERYYLAKV